MPADAAIEARGLRRSFGALPAVDGVDLTVRRGEFLTIFGPNGAGKTTLLRLLCGLLRPTAGQVKLLGLPHARGAPATRSRIGLIAHAPFLYGGLTARENLRFYARLYDLPDRDARVDSMLSQVGLSHRASDLVRTYSRGMQQRLTIARALLHDPEVVFLDEPYTGLDRQAARVLRSLLDAIRGRGRTVLMVTHNLEEGLELSTRIAIMSDGRFVEDRPVSGMTRGELEALYASRVEAWTS
ncbi:MAG: heme ABC exporter ATP-binding protein CcmA [Acidobacteria bacterium]|nr:heme ABC exporter ATP-binding protein CcmA [Acidobacteriota bacterium]